MACSACNDRGYKTKMGAGNSPEKVDCPVCHGMSTPEVVENGVPFVQFVSMTKEQIKNFR